VIQRVVRARFPVFRRCYEAGLAINVNLTGRVMIKFVIDPNGEVHSAADEGSTLPNADVVACVAHHFLELSFPRPQPDKPVTVVYPIQFNFAD
jgi:hypothetical protein